VPLVIAEEDPHGIVLVIADEVEIGSDVPFLQPCIENSEAMPDLFGLQPLLVVGISETSSDLLELGGLEGADVADLVEDLSGDTVVPLE
jgi:hypothetical protein